ncbi:hypothetical protein D3C87_1349620 [compost metagenome]
MWSHYPGVCEITSITNAQNQAYWEDPVIGKAIATGNDKDIARRKKEMKAELFKVVANQYGKLFNPDVITIVWARRFAGYKRADLVMQDWNRFLSLVENEALAVQFIWAGKPYPEDFGAIGLFNQIISRALPLKNCAVLTGYELELSALLKKGSDVWLNNPRMYREASGTSGMTAAMNGSINLSLPDGWVPEFAEDKRNSFLIQPAPDGSSEQDQDRLENISLMDTLEQNVLPMYYNEPKQWLNLVKKAATDVVPTFEAGRMAAEYYSKMYKG